MAAAILACVSCGSQQSARPSEARQSVPSGVHSADCIASNTPPTGATRVYIGLRNGNDGSGQTADDARDGSTPAAFDTILRCYEEGCAGPPAIPRKDNLIICLGPGTFSTLGNYDALIDQPHPTPRGFRIGKGWKIHGQGADQTTLQLSDYLPITVPNNALALPVGTGVNLALSTSSHKSSGVEISDLTIDANYPALRRRADLNGTGALNLEAIRLWSAQGGNWIHDMNIINSAGEIGAIDQVWESFTVLAGSAIHNSSPLDCAGNLIENVNMHDFGGGKGGGITIANAVAEVRNNHVEGFNIGYGGWSMGPVNFHHNSSLNNTYGFNIDSLINNGVRIESNQIVTNNGYGLVIGGGGVYSDLVITGNTISIGDRVSTGILFQGNVAHSTITGNSFTVAGPGSGAAAIHNFSNGALAGPNGNNVYQSNVIDSRLSVIFEAPSMPSMNCSFGNRDEKGNPRVDLPNTSATPCVP